MNVLARSPRRHALRALVGLTAAAVAAAGALVAPAAAALVPADASRAGLYGSTDPTYDGVFRQSLAMLGIYAAGEDTPQAAEAWLLAQQCEDGSFPSFDPTPSDACPAYAPSTFSGGKNTDSTALAILVLRAGNGGLGTSDALDWLEDQQQSDGGWEYTVGDGFGTNPNSTAIALMALREFGRTPTYDAVGYFEDRQVGRSGTPDPADRGGISAFQPGVPNLLATVQAIPALAGSSLVDLAPPASLWQEELNEYPAVPAADDETIADWALTWLATQSATADYAGNRAWAVLAYASLATGRAKAAATYDLLRTSVKESDPGALGLAALAATAMRETTDAQRFATLTLATLTPGTGRDPAAPATFTVAPATLWAGRTVTVGNPNATGAGSALPLTQTMSWGDGTSSPLVGTSASHAYRRGGTFRPVITLTYAGAARSARVALPPVTVRVDAFDPRVILIKPGKPAKVSSWRTLRGTSSDVGLGVRSIRLALVQKRGADWYSYSNGRWSNKVTYARAVAFAQRRYVAPASNGTWSLSVKNLTRGDLRIRYVAIDEAGNASSVRTVKQKLTKK